MMGNQMRRLPLFGCASILLLLSVLQSSESQAAAQKMDLQPFERSSQGKGFTLEEAARYTGLSYREVLALMKTGHLMPTKIASTWYVHKSELIKWLEYPAIAKNVILRSLRQNTELRFAGRDENPETLDTKHSVVQPDTHSNKGPLSKVVLAEIIGKGKPSSSSQNDDGTKNEGKTQPIGEAPEQDTAEEIFLQTQNVLLRARQLTIELGLFYTKSEAEGLTLLPGNILINALGEQDTFTSNLNIRYGLFHDVQLFAIGVLRRQKSTTRTTTSGGATPITQKTSSTLTEFGDFTLGVRSVVLHEAAGRPDIILSIDGIIPTRSSSYGIEGNIALSKRSDPIALFANFNYLHKFSREFSDFSRLEPENTFAATLGYSFAVNDTISLNTLVSGIFSRPTNFDKSTTPDLPATERFTLQLGLTSLITERLYIQPSLTFALNGPANVTAGVSIPYILDL